MSLGTFLKKIWQGVKNLFKSLPKEAKNAIHIGVVVVDKIKTWVDSGAADVLTAIIPGDLDDKIKDKLREVLPKILQELKLADTCGSLTDPQQITTCAIATLQKIGDDFISDGAKKRFYDSIAVLIAAVVSDGKLTVSDAAYVLKWYYDHVYKAKQETD